MNNTTKIDAERVQPAPRGKSFEPEVAKAFGSVIRKERVRKGVAQDQLALIADIDRSYLGKLERGERQPSLGMLLRIGGSLEVSGAELVRRVESALDGRTHASTEESTRKQ